MLALYYSLSGLNNEGLYKSEGALVAYSGCVAVKMFSC
jgi:hypothetical protein